MYWRRALQDWSEAFDDLGRKQVGFYCTGALFAVTTRILFKIQFDSSQLDELEN